MTSLDGINGWSIQTLLRGENDSKQSDEFQASNSVLSPNMKTFVAEGWTYCPQFWERQHGDVDLKTGSTNGRATNYAPEVALSPLRAPSHSHLTVFTKSVYM